MIGGSVEKSLQSNEITKIADYSSVGADIAGPAHASDLEEREEVAKLAYLYWLDRGCPDGSPEDDWLRAEQEVQQQHNRTVK